MLQWLYQFLWCMLSFSLKKNIRISIVCQRVLTALIVKDQSLSSQWAGVDLASFLSSSLSHSQLLSQLLLSIAVPSLTYERACACALTCALLFKSYKLTVIATVQQRINREIRTCRPHGVHRHDTEWLATKAGCDQKLQICLDGCCTLWSGCDMLLKPETSKVDFCTRPLACSLLLILVSDFDSEWVIVRGLHKGDSWYMDTLFCIPQKYIKPNTLDR